MMLPEAVKERIAALFVVDARWAAASETDQQCRAKGNEELKEVRRAVSVTVEALERLKSPRGGMIRDYAFGAVAYAAVVGRSSSEPSFEEADLLNHVANIEVLAKELREMMTVLDIAIDNEQLHDVETGSGRPPDLALRMLIIRAGTHWRGTTGNLPPLSKSALGTFGRCVKEIIGRVPEELRPKISEERLVSRIWDTLKPQNKDRVAK